jgi:flagellar hook-associated protein 1
MLGLLGTLNLGARSLQVQRQGIEVSGHNIANANNPAYTRQRLAIQSAEALDSFLGPQGSGVDSSAILRLRSDFLDRQIQFEKSVGGYIDAQQSALSQAQANLGHQIDRRGGLEPGSLAGLAPGIGEAINSLFNAFQSLSTNPTSLAERQVLIATASELASRLNTAHDRLSNLDQALSQLIDADASSVNRLLDQIAHLNGRIGSSEMASGGLANDLRDMRQQRIEELAALVKFDIASNDGGRSLNIVIGSTIFVSGQDVLDKLETYDSGEGRMLVRAKSSGESLVLTGGSIAGTIDVRDNEIAALRSSMDVLASVLAGEINEAHAAGFSLHGTTGAEFFSGTGAGGIRVNAALVSDPSLLQASGVPDATGDNTVALALARLQGKNHAALGNQTFIQSYGNAVAKLGHALHSIEQKLDDQRAVEEMLSRQRASMSAVSLDEEMTDLMKFQKAFEASARLIAIVDEMFATVLAMKR